MVKTPSLLLHFRSHFIHCNELTVDVEYIEKEKGRDIPGSIDAIQAITACMNSGKGGIVTLRQKNYSLIECHAERDRKQPKVLSEDFDQTLEEHFRRYNQSGNFEIEPFSSETTFRKVFVKALNQPNVLCQSYAYERLNSSSIEVHSTECHQKIFTRQDLEEDLEPLVLPESILYGEDLKCAMNVEKMVVFKESGIQQVENNFEDKCGKYISSFANTVGGHIIYGVTDEAIVTDKIGKAEEKRFCEAIADNVEKMVWYHVDEGRIQPKEGQHWKLKFVPVQGAPNGKECMLGILTVPFFKGIVYFRSPKCPVLDAETGVTMLNCDEWCAHLKELCCAVIKKSDPQVIIYINVQYDI